MQGATSTIDSKLGLAIDAASRIKTPRRSLPIAWEHHRRHRRNTSEAEWIDGSSSHMSSLRALGGVMESLVDYGI